MKILKVYTNPERVEPIISQVLSVVRETKTLLIAIDRRHPRETYRFRKPCNPQTGTYVYPPGKCSMRSSFHYEICLED